MKQKLLLLPIMVLFLFASCENDSQMMDNPMPRRITPTSTTLGNEIGQLHNDAIIDFLTYVENQGITPFYNGFLTDAVITNYVEEYVLANLDMTYYDNYLNIQSLHVNETRLTAFKNSLFDIFENPLLSTNDMELAIIQLTDDYMNESGYEDETIIMEIIGNVAKGTNTLWGSEWDFDEYPFVPAIYQTAVADTITEEKEKEEQQELKKADVRGAIEGAIEGYITGGQEGAIKGAAAGAITKSIVEIIIQELDLVAIVIPEEDVNTINTQSYFYHYLQQELNYDTQAFHERYGYKFDDIL